MFPSIRRCSSCTFKSGIESGALNLAHSYKYRPLDDYLIDRARWQRDKQRLIERAGLEALG